MIGNGEHSNSVVVNKMCELVPYEKSHARAKHLKRENAHAQRPLVCWSQQLDKKVDKSVVANFYLGHSVRVLPLSVRREAQRGQRVDYGKSNRAQIRWLERNNAWLQQPRLWVELGQAMPRARHQLEELRN